SKGVVPSRRPWTERTLRSGHPELMGVQVRPLSELSYTLLESAPVTRIRWVSASNWTLARLESRRDTIFFQESPASVLRYTPSRVASQIFLELSTAAA